MAPLSCIELTRDEKAQLLIIAWESIEQGLDTNQPLDLDSSQLSGNLAATFGSFVTLTQRGLLRGCVGSIEAMHPLAQGVAVAAFKAAYRDHRFPKLSNAEIEHTQLEISVLSQPEAIAASTDAELLAKLRPYEDGLLVECDGHRATFLPKVWKKLADPEQFVRQLKAKAGLPDDYWSNSIRFYRYHTICEARSVSDRVSASRCSSSS